MYILTFNGLRLFINAFSNMYYLIDNVLVSREINNVDGSEQLIYTFEMIFKHEVPLKVTKHENSYFILV